MAHSYAGLFIHYIFSTKNRENLILKEMQPELWAYLGGIARKNDMKSLAVGGTANHIHLLVQLPRTSSVANAIRVIKAGSSKWISDTFESRDNFEWQKGYGAFSVSISKLDPSIEYIRNQKEHHRNKTFKEEYLLFLNKYRIEYQDKYVFG